MDKFCTGIHLDINVLELMFKWIPVQNSRVFRMNFHSGLCSESSSYVYFKAVAESYHFVEQTIC